MGTLMDNIEKSPIWTEKFIWQMQVRAHRGSLDTTKIATLYFVTEQDARKWFNRQKMVTSEKVAEIIMDSLQAILYDPNKKPTIFDEYKGAGNFS